MALATNKTPTTIASHKNTRHVNLNFGYGDSTVTPSP